MRIMKQWIVYFSLILLIFPVLSITASSDDGPPLWNREWSYREEITLPIFTDDPHAIYQPIDLHIEFSNPCWALNEKDHSIRICCYFGNKWYELELQIYDLEFTDSHHIKRCGIVFLIPEFANGEERYFVYYDGGKKPSPNYIDHVSIEDAYYYFAPIAGVSAEADYYNIEQDGFCVYAIGQKGKAMNRQLSQVVIAMKPETKEFDVPNSENMASFAFAYNIGEKDEDHMASDQKLISKEIRIDGNLMVECGIVSESNEKELRTTNIYRYYYYPTDNKRMNVHVKHQVFKEGIVKGQINVDGAYGALISYKSRSGKISRLRFGEILPYLHVYGENNQIKEYNMNTNPEVKEREWIVPYTDDCDIGEDAWFSYDEGESGKAFGILFSSNKNIVKYGKDERDGIQIKANEKEYLDVLGAEIDYAAVVFGRNSYEKGEFHDKKIAEDLVVEFNAEYFTSYEGGYKEIIPEAEYFRTLVKFRQDGQDGLDGGSENIYTLTIFPKLTAGLLHFPFIREIFKFNVSKVWGELYQNDELISISYVTRALFGPPIIKFPKLAKGTYMVKIFRQIFDGEKKVIGMDVVEIEDDKIKKIICTWQKEITISVKDQNAERIEGLELSLFRNETLFMTNITNKNEDILMKVNYNLFELYILKATYKGFMIYNEQILRRIESVGINLDLYDLTINIKDELGFSPGVNVRPSLTSSEMAIAKDLTPDEVINGENLFKKLPMANYKLYISYGRFTDEMYIDVPEDGDSQSIKFSAVFDLDTDLLDYHGNALQDKNLKLNVKREGKKIFSSISPDKVVTLPPGKYTIEVYSEDKLVGSKVVELTNTKNVKIVTEIESIIPIIITGIFLLFIIEIIVFILLKRISLNTFLKLLAISLILLSLFQPWWALNAESDTTTAGKNSEMYIFSQSMIERTTYDGETYLDVATLPEIFTTFLGTLLLIIYTGLALLCFSFIPNILLKRRFFIVLISASILFLTLVALAFSFGMSKITEISLGGLIGRSTLDILLPNGETVYMSATWGLGPGFYLCIFSAILLIGTGLVDYLRKREWPLTLLSKNDVIIT